jgi:NitT/TauT family transport system ATP-binding protein
MILSIENLFKRYRTRNSEILALHDLHLQVKPREFISIVGPSGCGKSTLLKIIAGILQPTTGKIRFNYPKLSTNLETDLVFQEHGLFPWLDVQHNVEFGLKMQGVQKSTREEKALRLLTRFGLQEFTQAFPYQLSGGMKQRVALARAIVSDPAILLMDEPFGALDSQNRMLLQEELINLWRDYRKTVLFVTHDIDEAILLSDRVLVMSRRPGKIIDQYQIPSEIRRDLTDRFHPMIHEYKKQIWYQIKNEVQKDFQTS